MRIFFFGLVFIMNIGECPALIHERTDYFLDLELSKTKFLVTCSGDSKDDNAILGFHLLDGETYYNFYYRRVRTVKDCHELKKEYVDLLMGHDSVRIVANHPTERVMLDSEKKASPSPFNKASKIIFGPFVRLQVGFKCKAYFSEDCNLLKNYWGGVIPGK